MVFVPTLVINLAERGDKLLKVTQSFNAWPVPIERVDAVKMQVGWKGCSKSHYKCIKLAKDRGYPFVIIIEDDCMLAKDGLERFQNILPLLKNRTSEWDIFYGGPTFIDNISIASYSPPIFNIKAFSLHFILLHAGSYDKILNSFDDTIPVDVYYRNTLRGCCTVPHIATQFPGQSDIEKSLSDYNKLFKESEVKLIKKLDEGFMNESKQFNNQIILINGIILFTLVILAFRFK